MALSRDDINQLICEVWAPSVDLELYPVDDETGVREHAAVIEASGAWDGRVVVRATGSFARAVAANMFGMPRHEVDQEDADDAIGELANVVGGNLKSLLDGGEVDLAVPQLGTDSHDGAEVTHTVLAGGDGFEVTVVVLEGARTPAA